MSYPRRTEALEAMVLSLADRSFSREGHPRAQRESHRHQVSTPSLFFLSPVRPALANYCHPRGFTFLSCGAATLRTEVARETRGGAKRS